MGIERGVIHRNTKPSNIIVEPDGQPKILDFGISRVSSFESTLTEPSIQMGSVAYMSPEQIVNPVPNQSHPPQPITGGMVVTNRLLCR